MFLGGCTYTRSCSSCDWFRYRSDLGSCTVRNRLVRPWGVLMATLGGGCGVIVVAFPHVTFRTLGAGCESWCEGAIVCTGVSDRGEASKCLTCASSRRERCTFAGDIILGTDVLGPTESGTGLLACQFVQASRKSLIACNCALQRAVGTPANAPVSDCKPCSI